MENICCLTVNENTAEYMLNRLYLKYIDFKLILIIIHNLIKRNFKLLLIKKNMSLYDDTV